MWIDRVIRRDHQRSGKSTGRLRRKDHLKCAIAPKSHPIALVAGYRETTSIHRNARDGYGDGAGILNRHGRRH